METYDTNQDGQLDTSELDQCLAMKSALSRVDTDRDGTISHKEIAQRIEAYQSQSDFITTTILLHSKRRPVSGATAIVEFEPFMGKHLAQYSGETNELGIVGPIKDQSDLPVGLMPPGFYRVRITLPGGGSEIVRGCEIADGVLENGQLVISLD